jgi:molybdopterin converting factor small subunit
MTQENCVRIKVRVLGELAAEFGERDLDLELPASSTARDALRRLLGEFRRSTDDPAAGRGQQVGGQVVAFLNGRNIEILSPAEERLLEGDLLLITRPIGGG